MDINLYIERIEQYETGGMSSPERSVFEAELTSNADLRQAHALFLQTNDVIEQGIENSLRSQLQGWAGASSQAPIVATKTVGNKVVPMTSTWARLAVAASVALLMGWFGWQWAGGQYSDQALYAGYYEKPPDTAFRAPGTDHPLQQGFDAMKANHLEDAVAFFSSITSDNDRYAEAQYYLGHASLQLKKYDSAIEAFRQCAARTDSKFREKAEWNLLLTYMAAGRTGGAEFKALLEQVAGNAGHSYQKQAQALAGDMRSFWRK